MAADVAYWTAAIVVQPVLMWFLVGFWQRRRTPPWERDRG